MSDTNPARSGGEFFVNVFSGAGLGLLLGVIVGLSISPVVSIVVGALASLLAVFLGLQGGEESKLAALGSVRLNGVRIGSFGFATVIGLLLALYIRANDPFAEPIKEHFDRWKTAKLGDERAQDMVIYERTGIVPQGATVDPEITAKQLAAKTPVLYATLDQLNLCHDLDPERVGEDQQAEKLLRKYRKHENATLDRLADEVESLAPDHRLPALVVLHKFMCELRKERSQ